MKRSGSITALDLSNRNAAHKALARTHRNAPLRSAATLDRAHFFEPLEPRVFMSASATVSQLLDQTGGTTSADALLTTPRRTAARLIDSPTGTLVAQTGAPAPAASDSTSSSTTGGTTSGSTVTGTTGGTSSNTISAVATSTGSSTPTRQPVLSPSKPRSSADYRYILRPGTGFTGPSVADPEIVNQDQTKAGWDEKAIARWDVVPYQTFTDTFNVGVVAFHMNGIKEVAFSVNGGDWTAVRSMTKNPQTDVYEYTATLNASDFQAGQIEVRAIAYPKCGLPRLLGGPFANNPANDKGENSMFLFANAENALPQLIRWVSNDGDDSTGDGSEERPFRTIWKANNSIATANGSNSASNGLIYAKAGDYSWAGAGNRATVGNTSKSWITFTHAPGLTRDQVRITGGSPSDELDTCLVHIKDVSVYRATFYGKSSLNPHIWFDGVLFDNGTRTSDVRPIPANSWLGGAYATDCRFQNVGNGPIGFTLVRHVSEYNIQQIAFYATDMVIDGSLDHLDARNDDLSASGVHSDVWAFTNNGFENAIIYGLTATTWIRGQGIATGDKTRPIGRQSLAKDFAIVNVQITVDPTFSGAQDLQWAQPHVHTYTKDSTFISLGASSMLRTDLGFSATDVVFDRVVFNPSLVTSTPGQSPDDLPGVSILS